MSFQAEDVVQFELKKGVQVQIVVYPNAEYVNSPATGPMNATGYIPHSMINLQYLEDNSSKPPQLIGGILSTWDPSIMQNASDEVTWQSAFASAKMRVDSTRDATLQQIAEKLLEGFIGGKEPNPSVASFLAVKKTSYGSSDVALIAQAISPTLTPVILEGYSKSEKSGLYLPSSSIVHSKLPLDIAFDSDSNFYRIAVAFVDEKVAREIKSNLNLNTDLERLFVKKYSSLKRFFGIDDTRDWVEKERNLLAEIQGILALTLSHQNQKPANFCFAASMRIAKAS